jgi:hypothetical protein
MGLNCERFTMAHIETIEFHHHIHPIAILLLIALAAIFLLVIGAFSQARRNANQRAIQKGPFDKPGTGPPNIAQRSSPVGVCQRCRSALAVDAGYCARCGQPVTHPTPLPMPRQRTQPGSSRWFIYAIIALLGVIGFSTFWFYASLGPDPVPAPPVRQHAPSDAW